MKLTAGLDVHKEKCAVHIAYGGLNKPSAKQQAVIDKMNEELRRIPSDYRGMKKLADRLKDHEAYILMENSTKSHNVYWMLKELGMNVIVAHSTDLERITKSQRKNDDNDARELAHYMRRRLMGENEFHEAYIPSREVLQKRELCRMALEDRSSLTTVKLQIRSHLLIRGMELSKNYRDIACTSALRELGQTMDTVLRIDAKKAEDLKTRIRFIEKTIRQSMMDDPVFDIVYSIPGFGVVSAAYVSCMGDDFSRFPDGRSYAASIGLIPKQDNSADTDKQCGITRRGDADLRRIMCQATFVHVFHADSHISRKYERLRNEGKSFNETLVACANSMCRMVFAMVRNGQRFVTDPKTLAKARVYADSGDVETDLEEERLRF